MRFPILASLFFLSAAAVRAQDAPQIQADVIYGHKDGMALTFDVLRPAKPNGAGILYIQSGGWYSGWRDPKLLVAVSQPFLAKGFTVFLVYHGSSPRFAVPDAVADVKRCATYIHQHAADLGVDANRLGVLGGSAGGHLSLMLGTTGDAESKIAAVVALYPPTDLRGWTTNPPAAIASKPQLKPSLTFPAEKEAEVSPILQVTADDSPILMIHGDKDELVTPDHSDKMLAALQDAKVESKLIVVKGAGHGFNMEQNQSIVIPAMVDWFVQHLAKSAN